MEVSVPKSTGRALQFQSKTLEVKGEADFFRVGKLNNEVYIIAAVKKYVGGFTIYLKFGSLGSDEVVLHSWILIFMSGKQ